jgi:hypothetical protein
MRQFLIEFNDLILQRVTEDSILPLLVKKDVITELEKQEIENLGEISNRKQLITILGSK